MPRWRAVYHLRPPGPTVEAIEVYQVEEGRRTPGDVLRRSPPYRYRAHIEGADEHETHTGWAVVLGHTDPEGAGGYLDVHQALGTASSLGSQTLRRLSPGRAIREALWVLRADQRMADWVTTDWPEREWAQLVERAGERLAQGSLRPHHQARLQRAVLAATYADAVAAGDPRPVVTVAARHGMRRGQVSPLIYKARHDDGFLTETARGKHGGQLTDAARAVLEGGPER
jgi:hypothetical protein